MHEKVVLIGAGSASFTRGLLADMIHAGWTGELALVDTDPKAMEVAQGLAQKMIKLGGVALKVSATTDRRNALPGATAVICTVGVGGRRAWEQDVLIPRKYGIYQPVGDSVMPGGSSRALRMIHAMVEIARDVQKLAPKALFINYGNPMSPVCRGIRKATGAQVIGLCHGVPNCSHHLEHILGVERGQLAYTATGINHMTWFTDVRSATGEDLMPKLLKIAREKAAITLTPDSFGLETWLGDTVTKPQETPFTWQLTNTFGAYPVPGDRHVTEFFGRLFAGKGAYYGKTLGVDAYTFEGTIRSGDSWYAEMTKLALSPDALPADFLGRGGGEHEQVVDIIQSVRTNRGRQYSMNLPNTGQVANLPADAVIECPAVADGAGMRPVIVGPLPTAIAGTLATRFAWVETIVEAALEGSRPKFVQALLLDGAVDSVDTANRLADDLLAAQKQYLPQFQA